MEIDVTHGGKADFYHVGRVFYPVEFFDYIYGDLGISEKDIIADIGSGTGKITRGFLERGNIVFAIEPDHDMRRISDEDLSSYENYISINKTAEDTGLIDKSIDCIFCGNSFMWFNHSRAIPEFQRILKPNGKLIISNLGNGINEFNNDLEQITERYKNSNLKKISNTNIPFEVNTYLKKSINFIVEESYEKFLCGVLSSSYAPNISDSNFKEFCDQIFKVFKQYSSNDKIKVNMCLSFIVIKFESIVKSN